MVLAAGFAPALATFSRRVSSVGLRELLAQGQDWSLQPVLLRQNRFTKAIRRLLYGGVLAVRKHAIPSAALGGAGL